MSISRTQGCSTTRRLKRTSSASRPRDLPARAPRTPFERGINAGLFHHPTRERRVQRRQGQGAILVDFDERAAGAEQQHRAELESMLLPTISS